MNGGNGTKRRPQLVRDRKGQMVKSRCLRGPIAQYASALT